MRFPILILITLLHTGSTYRAAVLEYSPVIGTTPKDTLTKNIEAYRHYADQAKTQNVDIIIFPEYGLTTLQALEDVTQYATEVNHENYIIIDLETIARKNQIYLVANLLEKKGTNYYNTNVVFDRRGKIILTYRKIHLFKEPELSSGAADQVVTFGTDFGVTFGIFTSFDILWANPARTVLHNSAVTDIIFPTAWSAAMPFDMPLSVQHGYSLAHGVNLLVAGYDDPEKRLSGSGIYLASGEIADVYIGRILWSTLLVQDVPKISKREDKTKCKTLTESSGSSKKEDMLDFHTFDDYTNKSLYKHENLDLGQNFSSYEICNKGFCCTFDISIEAKPIVFQGTYKLIAYNNNFTLMNAHWHLRVCGLLYCTTESVESCGTLSLSSVKFRKIAIKGKLDKDTWTYFMPITLNAYFQPVRSTSYCVVEKTNESSVVEVSTSTSQEDVLVFGLSGILISSASSRIFSLALLTTCWTVLNKL